MDLPKHFLFLASTGRSGTTITRRSLGLHPEIYYNGKENNLVQDVISAAQDNCTLKSRKHAMVVTQTEYDAAFRDLICRLVWPDSECRKKPIWMAAINPTGDLLDYLTQVFPATKVICLIRNPVGMISSRTRYDSFQHGTFENHCNTWLRSEPVYRWCLQHPDSGKVLRHEWLHGPELEPNLDLVFKWLGLNSDSAVIENIRTKLVHPTGEATDLSSLDLSERRDYFAAKQERWKNWSDVDRQTFKKICGAFATELGYPIPF